MDGHFSEALDYVERYLQTHHVVIVSTMTAEGSSWSWPVYYVYVRNLLLFVSKAASRHASDIGEGAHVSFVITETDQEPPTSAHAIQAEGIARPATVFEYPLFVRHYAGKFVKYSANMLNVEELRRSLTDASSGRPYVIQPSYLKLTDKRFREEPVELDLRSIKDEASSLPE